MKNPDTALWWTPEGFVSLEAPESLKNFYRFVDTHKDWDKALHEAGYERISRTGDETDELELTIYTHKTDHYFIELSGSDMGLSSFCVTIENSDRFYATWYIDFIKAHAISNLVDIIRPLKKTLIAFVRHGHGTQTVDQYGFWTLDDQIAWEDRKR